MLVLVLLLPHGVEDHLLTPRLDLADRDAEDRFLNHRLDIVGHVLDHIGDIIEEVSLHPQRDDGTDAAARGVRAALEVEGRTLLDGVLLVLGLGPAEPKERDAPPSQ